MYELAVQQYEKFLTAFPQHPKAFQARLRIGEEQLHRVRSGSAAFRCETLVTAEAPIVYAPSPRWVIDLVRSTFPTPPRDGRGRPGAGDHGGGRQPGPRLAGAVLAGLPGRSGGLRLRPHRHEVAAGGGRAMRLPRGMGPP